MHDKQLEDLVIYVDLEEDDPRVMYDTTRSIFKTWNEFEEMIIMLPGITTAKVDKMSRCSTLKVVEEAKDT